MFPYLCLREVEGGCEVDPLGRGEVALRLEAALQPAQLRVREHRPRLPPPTAVLPRLAREQRGERQACEYATKIFTLVISPIQVNLLYLY